MLKIDLHKDVEAKQDKLSTRDRGSQQEYSEAITHFILRELGWAAGEALGRGDISAVDEINTRSRGDFFVFKTGRAYADHGVTVPAFAKS